MFAPTAFAQFALTFGGSAEAGAVLAEDTIIKDQDAKPGARTYWGFTLTGSAASEEGNVGAKGAFINGVRNYWAYIWWKPMDMFFLKFGNIFEESTWAGSDLTGEKGLHSNEFPVKPGYTMFPNGFAGNVLADKTGFYPGFSSDRIARLQVSAYPVEGLSVNLGLEMMRTSSAGFEIMQNYIEKLNAQLVYDIDGIGEAAIAFVNGLSDEEKNIYAQWKMPIGDAMRIEAGINYTIKVENEVLDPPLNLGIGFAMDGFGKNDQMAITARFGAAIPMNDIDHPLIGLDVVFTYDFEDLFKLYIPFGIGLRLPVEGTIFAWNFHPYLTKKLGGPSFFAGVTFFNGTAQDMVIYGNKDTINWTIPVGLRWDF
jgi:hypothetical protein